MERRDFNRMRRSELLELLQEQVQQNRTLQEKVKKLEKELEARPVESKIHYEKVGSLAEASLRLNRVFEAADRAASDFLKNLRRDLLNKVEAMTSEASSLEAFADLDKEAAGKTGEKESELPVIEDADKVG